MLLSEKTLKWIMRMYPPLLFQRIWVQKFSQDFHSVEIKIIKSFLNKNYNGSIFGGTIYAAADPFHAVLFDQLLRRKGFKVRIWLKAGEIQYLKPARTDLYLKITIKDEDLAEAEKLLTTVGKFVKTFPVEIYNEHGLLCVSLNNEVYIRNLHKDENSTIAY
jgi:hypothetical protein